MRRFTLGAILLVLAAVLPRAAAQESGKLQLKTAEVPPPKELSEPIRKELAGTALQVYDPAGKLAAELWFCKAIPGPAKKGVTYRDLRQGELFGAVKFLKSWKDYRKQPVEPGVYTLRLAFQPTDGKHTADVSEYPDFLLVVTAKADTNPDVLDPKKLQEESGDSIGSGHPGLFMLAPNPQPGAMPQLVQRPREQQVINTRTELTAGGQPAGALGIGLTIVGHTPAE